MSFLSYISYAGRSTSADKLTETHFIRHDTSPSSTRHQSSRTLVQELIHQPICLLYLYLLMLWCREAYLDTFDLMRSEHFRQDRINHHWYLDLLLFLDIHYP